MKGLDRIFLSIISFKVSFIFLPPLGFERRRTFSYFFLPNWTDEKLCKTGQNQGEILSFPSNLPLDSETGPGRVLAEVMMWNIIKE